METEMEDRLEEAEDALLRKCKLNRKQLKKLFSVLDKFQGDADGAEDLVNKFANKCYGSAGNEEDSINQAMVFCQTFFGDIETLYRQGPKEAFEMYKRDLASAGARKPQWDFEFGKYYIGHQLGVGGTATVLLGYDTDSKSEVAVKVYKPQFASTAAREGAILKALNHPNIIKVYDCFENCQWQDGRTTVIVLEYANRGELIEYLMFTKRFEPKLARWVFRGVLQAVGHCHSRDPPIVHRDLKHDNCLFGDSSEGDIMVKINDFGFSKPLADGVEMRSMIGTEQYAAPEILKGEVYDHRVDIFAIGVMLFVSLSGSQPFRRADRNDPWYKKVVKGEWDKFWKAHTNRETAYQFDDTEINLLEGMLAYRPDDRLTLQQVVDHPWTSGESYDNETARAKLERRKKRMDWQKYKDSQGGATPVRDIKKDRAKDKFPAPLYHTNTPSPGLWFYSIEQPSVIIEAIHAMVSGKRFAGRSNYDAALDFQVEDAKKSRSNSKESVSDNKEQEGEEDTVTTTKAPAMVRLTTNTENMSAKEAMNHGKFSLKFEIVVNKQPERGVVHVFGCPDDPETNIVMFRPGFGTSTMIFPQLYSVLLAGSGETGGLAALMANPEATHKKFSKIDGMKRPPRVSFSE